MLGAIYGVCGLVATLMISEPEDSASETMSFTSADSEKSEEAAREIQTSLRPTEVLRTAVFYQVSTSCLWKTRTPVPVWSLKSTLLNCQWPVYCNVLIQMRV